MDNTLLLAGETSIDQLSKLFDAARSGPDWIEFGGGVSSCRMILLDTSSNAPLRPELGDRVASVLNYFASHLRGVKVTDEMVGEEIDVVATFLTELRDQFPAGYYDNDDHPFVRWDWRSYGVRFNSDPRWWHRPESRLLRDRLREAGVLFEAYRYTESIVNVPIVTESDERRPLYLWGSHHSGSTEFVTTLEHLGATVTTTTGFARYANPPNFYYVEIEGLEELVRNLVSLAESDPAKLEIVADWRGVLTNATALLVNSGRPLVGSLVDERWALLLAEAKILAPQLIQNPDGPTDRQRQLGLGPGDW